MAKLRSSLVYGVLIAAAVLARAVAAGEDPPPKPESPATGDLYTPSGRCWCKLPHHERKARAALPRITPVAEVEPNNTPGTASAVPLGAGANLDQDVVIAGTITPSDDVDFFKFNAKRGDVLAFATNSGFDTVGAVTDAADNVLMDNDDLNAVPFVYPDSSPLPLPLDPKRDRNSALAYIVPADGEYYLKVSSYGATSGGSYQMQATLRRPYLEIQDLYAKQIIFVDFDGASVPALDLFGDGKTLADLSPLRNFMTAWGLTTADEAAVIDKAMAVVKQKYDALRLAALNGNRPVDNQPGHYDVEFQNSKDNVDTFGQPFASRVVVGGTMSELGIQTVGIASCIDPGNFSSQDTAVVLLDLMSAPDGDGDSVNSLQLAANVSKVDAVGLTIGTVVAHEMSHYLGDYHTSNMNALNAITDAGGLGIEYRVGAGPDNTVGTADDQPRPFAPDFFDPFEGTSYSNIREDTPLQTAFALSTGSIPGGSGPPITVRPDLIPSNLSISADPLVAGTPFTVTVRVGNAGSAPATDFLVSLFLDQAVVVSSSAGSAASVQASGALNPGEYRQVTLTASYPAPGEYTLAVLADSQSSVNESNELNNMLFRPVLVYAQGVDLVVPTVSVTQPNPGLTAGFDAMIQNRGMTPSSAFQVGFYANLGAAPSPADTPTAVAEVAGLAAGAAMTVHFELPPQDVPRAGFAWFFADRANTIAEDMETNNTARASWGVPNEAFTIVSPLTPSAQVGGIGEPLQFSIGVSDPNNDPMSYSWDFGDGTVVNGGSTITHAFAAEGFYTVRVTVADGPFHSQTVSILVEIVQEVVDLGVVHLSVKRGRFKFVIPRPAGFSPMDRLKSMVVAGNPGEKARYRNLRLLGTAKVKGQYGFLVEYQSKATYYVRRVRYRYTVVD